MTEEQLKFHGTVRKMFPKSPEKAAPRPTVRSRGVQVTIQAGADCKICRVREDFHLKSKNKTEICSPELIKTVNPCPWCDADFIPPETTSTVNVK